MITQHWFEIQVWIKAAQFNQSLNFSLTFVPSKIFPQSFTISKKKLMHRLTNSFFFFYITPQIQTHLSIGIITPSRNFGFLLHSPHSVYTRTLYKYIKYVDIVGTGVRIDFWSPFKNDAGVCCIHRSNLYRVKLYSTISGVAFFFRGWFCPPRWCGIYISRFRYKLRA